jgi:3-dehydroquinate synthetase
VAGLGVVPHGRAVAEGMRFAARLAVEAGGASKAFVAEQDALLDALGLPPLAQAYPASELLSRMYADKKVRNGELRFVLVQAPGTWRAVPITKDLAHKHLCTWEQSK